MRRKLLFRLTAILIGLSPFLIAELILRLADLGRPTDFNDPFVGFSEIHPLFVLDEDTNRYTIPKSRQTHFRPESFPAQKGENEMRIFVLGGSTVQGRPYRIETSFTTWLELSLNAADPARKWDVINCGGVSYASYRLVPILQEVLNYQPDLIILCTGQNEFLEDRSYGHLKESPEVLAWPQRNVSQLRTYNMIRQGFLRISDGTPEEIPEDRPELGPESEALLDWKHGIDEYHRDPEWQRGVIAHFAFNLRRLAHLAEVAEVPMIMMNPVSNLEWPPFKSQHRSDITEAELEEFRAVQKQAQNMIAEGRQERLRPRERLVEIDPEYALAWYHLGMMYRSLGETSDAERALIQAKDQDVCPLRMLEPMHELIEDVAEESDLPYVDMEIQIAARSRSGFPDNQWLVDHVHPTVEGHQLIAKALMRTLVEEEYLTPAPDWESTRDQAYAAHFETLDEAYFAWGDRRLKNVQAWAHGLADREKVEE